MYNPRGAWKPAVGWPPPQADSPPCPQQMELALQKLLKVERGIKDEAKEAAKPFVFHPIEPPSQPGGGGSSGAPGLTGTLAAVSREPEKERPRERRAEDDRRRERKEPSRVCDGAVASALWVQQWHARGRPSFVCSPSQPLLSWGGASLENFGNLWGPPHPHAITSIKKRRRD